MPPLETQAGTLLTAFGYQGYGEGAINPASSYELVADIYGCISRLQSSVAELPLVFKDRNKKIIDPDKKGTVANLFKSANSEDTGFEWKEQVVGDTHIDGNAYGFIQWEGVGTDKRPTEIWCLDFARVEPKVVGRRVAYYEYDLGNGEKKPLAREQVLHFRMYRPTRGYKGLGPVQVLQLATRTQRNMDLWLDAFYRKGGAVGGFLTTDGAMLPAQANAAKMELRRRGQGIQNAFDPVFLPKDFKFVRQGLDLQQMQFLETSGLKSADVYKVLRVPPVIMGTKQGGGLSDAGATTDMLLYWTLGVIPNCKRIAATINERFLAEPIYQGIYGVGITCEFDFRGVLPLAEALLSLIEAATKACDQPVASVNDVRVNVLGWEPSPKPEHNEVPDKPKPMAPGANEGGGAGGREASKDGLPPRALPAKAAVRTDLRARQDSRVASQEQAFRPAVRGLFAQQERRVVANLRRALSPERASGNGQVMGAALDVDALLPETAEDRSLIRRYLRRVLAFAGTVELADIGMRIAFRVRSERVAAWILRRAETMVVGTTRTTRGRLRESLAEGVRQNETHGEMVARVREVFRERYAGQAEVIVRTETVSAYGAGAYEAWLQANETSPGVVSGKQWVTAGDDLVRPEHVEADGQIRDLDEAFAVGGFELMFPGDWERGAPIELLACCRCTAAPVLGEARARLASILTATDTDASMLIEDLLASA